MLPAELRVETRTAQRVGARAEVLVEMHDHSPRGLSWLSILILLSVIFEASDVCADQQQQASLSSAVQVGRDLLPIDLFFIHTYTEVLRMSAYMCICEYEWHTCIKHVYTTCGSSAHDLDILTLLSLFVSDASGVQWRNRRLVRMRKPTRPRLPTRRRLRLQARRYALCAHTVLFNVRFVCTAVLLSRMKDWLWV